MTGIGMAWALSDGMVLILKDDAESWLPNNDNHEACLAIAV